jgi:hypothetical protein
MNLAWKYFQAEKILGMEFRSRHRTHSKPGISSAWNRESDCTTMHTPKETNDEKKCKARTSLKDILYQRSRQTSIISMLWVFQENEPLTNSHENKEVNSASSTSTAPISKPAARITHKKITPPYPYRSISISFTSASIKHSPHSPPHSQNNSDRAAKSSSPSPPHSSP